VQGTIVLNRGTLTLNLPLLKKTSFGAILPLMPWRSALTGKILGNLSIPLEEWTTSDAAHPLPWNQGGLLVMTRSGCPCHQICTQLDYEIEETTLQGIIDHVKGSTLFRNR
jgi:hypothetical protein